MTEFVNIPRFRKDRRIIKLLTIFTGKSFFAIIDQALYAGSNFLLNIVLARWLDPFQFGAFSTVYSWFFLVIGLHSAIIIEPMMVFGSGRHNTQFRRYLGCILPGNSFITIISGLIFAAASSFFTNEVMKTSMFGMAIAAPFILSQFTLRRSFYARSLPQWSATGGLVYAIIMFGGLFLSYQVKIISSFCAFVIMGIASLGVCLWFIFLTKPIFDDNDQTLSQKEVISEHWEYGRWALATSMVMWIPSNIYYSIFAISGSIEDNAALRALMNTILPVQHGISALAVILIPEYVKAIQQKGKQRLINIILGTSLLLFIISIIYGLILILFRNEILRFMYDDKFLQYASLLLIVAVIPIFTAGNGVFGSVLRSLEKPNKIFYCYIVTCLFSITGGIALAFNFQLIGVLYAITIGAGITTITMAWMMIRELRKIP